MNIKRPSSTQPIPPHAKEVFKGKIFSVYQWEQKMYDGTTATFEKLKRTDTVTVIPITVDGKIILSKQEQPGIAPFIGGLGGRIDEGEDPLTAAKRELLEETGFEAKEYILWDSAQPVGKIDWAVYTFVAKGAHKTQEQNVDAGENIQLIYVTFDEFLKYVVQKDFRDTEVAMKVLKAMNNPFLLEEMKQLLNP